MEARNVLRSLRENRDGLPSKRVRVELPLPKRIKEMKSFDWVAWAGCRLEGSISKDSQRRKSS